MRGRHFPSEVANGDTIQVRAVVESWAELA
jgi:hypothetical protein